MKKRNRLVDKKFQLKTTFSVIGIIVITLIALIAVTGLILSDNNRRIARAIQVVTPAHGAEAPAKQLDSNAETAALLQDLIGRNRMIITVMIITAVLLSITLYYYLINLTHRISGPIYVLTRHMDEIMAGRKPDFRELRKNDEFKEFYEQFTELLRRFGGK